MSETSHLSWLCPGCGRRVPLRVDRCHCGRMRDAPRTEGNPQPDHPPGAPASRRLPLAIWRTLPLDAKALVVVAVLLMAGGVGWALFGPQQSEQLPAILGYMERTPPRPTPTPPTRPPFKLPWWR